MIDTSFGGGPNQGFSNKHNNDSVHTVKSTLLINEPAGG